MHRGGRSGRFAIDPSAAACRNPSKPSRSTGRLPSPACPGPARARFYKAIKTLRVFLGYFRNKSAKLLDDAFYVWPNASILSRIVKGLTM